MDSLLHTTTAPLPTEAKIFLVAGSSQSANFAQEIRDQKRVWLAAGFTERDIACYYVVPFQEELEADQDQFVALAPDLADCYPASVKLLREHLRAAARAPFLYLYITAHGQRPISLRLADAAPDDEDYPALRRKARYPILDHYRLIIEALPDGAAYDTELLGAYRMGVEPRQLYLTPHYLAEALAATHGEVPKFVVLQACYSGGFITDPRGAADHLLSSLDQITVLTAARHDRDSFGCDHGEDRTFYGGALLDVLARDPKSPLAIDWAGVHRALRATIARLEADREYAPSEPAWFSNYTPAAAPDERP